MARVARVEQNDKLLGLVAAGLFWIFSGSIVDLRAGLDQYEEGSGKAYLPAIVTRANLINVTETYKMANVREKTMNLVANFTRKIEDQKRA